MNFKRFQISNIRVPNDVLFLHGSKNIRLRIIHNLLKKFQLSKGQVYTNNESDKNYYKQWLTQAYVSSSLKKEGVAYLLKKQAERSSPAFLIFDSCFDEDSLEFIAKVCKKANKYNVMVIISFNRGEKVPKILGELATCAMIGKNSNKYDRQELREIFGRLFETDKIFFKCFDYLTEESNLMVICENGTDDIQSQVFWYPTEKSERQPEIKRTEEKKVEEQSKETMTTEKDEELKHSEEPPKDKDNIVEEQPKETKDEQSDNSDYESENNAEEETVEREERGECCLM